MESLFVDDDLGQGDALVVAVLACQLQGRLVGFQAGVAEEHIGHARELNQLGGQLLLVGHVVVIAAVDDLGHLVLQGGHEFGMVMAQGVHGNAGQRIQVLLAIDVPKAAALTTFERDWQTPVGVHGVRRGGFNESSHA